MNMGSPTALTIIVGPHDHGVVRHATVVATTAGSPMVRLPHIADVDRAIANGDIAAATAHAGMVHCHFTDRLFGSDVASAAARFRRLVETCKGPVAVTLHDVPFNDGTPHANRRGVGYRLVASSADVVVVASGAERHRLQGLGVEATIGVIPLPVVTQRVAPPLSCRLSSPITDGAVPLPILAVAGFVYPGKGHAELIDAATLLRAPMRVVALGRCSDGHEHMEGELIRRAAAGGVQFAVTGYLAEDQLTAAMAHADVAVVPAPRPSASASLQSWIGAGRRPLVADNDYTAEVGEALPDAFIRYNPGSAVELARALEVALARPETTWRLGPLPAQVSLEQVAAAHLALYRSFRTVGSR